MGHWRGVVSSIAFCATCVGAPLLSQTSIAAAMLARTAPVMETDGSNSVAQPAASLEDALRSAFANAGVIFTGEVVSIERIPGAVVVRWRVEDAVRGVAAGAIYEQKEWDGLWADGNARYQVGERALVLLHAPSVGGYASPVADGVVPLRGDATTGTLDLRWMARQVAVTDAARLRPMMALRAAGGDFALSDALLRRSAQAASVPRPRGLMSLPSDGNDANNGAVTSGPSAEDTSAGNANEHVDGAMILGMLHAWQRTGTSGR